MKKIALFCGGLLVAATMLFVGCGKTVTPTINNYFGVENGTLIAQDMPNSNMDEIPTTYMNGNVIPGGSSYVTVTTANPASKILVAMDGEDGYYEVVPRYSTNNQYNVVIMVNQTIVLPEDEDSFVILVAYIDENGNVSGTWSSEVHLLAVGTGALQVSLSFDQDKDVDLHLFEPNGEHIYYGNSMSENGGELDLDSNAGCGIDGINNENITYDEDAYVEPGQYTVYVDMWSNCSPQEYPTNWVLSVFYGGALLGTRTGTFAVDAPSNHNNLDNIEPVMTFTIGDRGQVKTKSFESKPLTESAMMKLAEAAE